jgi:peptidoglycan/xylan/chitin deacetylase (PgdA/CDA1 family)
MRRSIEWPEGKLMCCTFTVAFEYYRKGGRMKKDPKIEVNMASISHVNYGGNAGIWRIMDICERNNVRATIDVNGVAVEKWPEAVKALHEAGHEIASHGITNDISMAELTLEEQRKEIQACTRIVKEVTGQRPVGWVGPGNLFTEETLGIVAEEGYIWSGDQCDDDIPYVVQVNGRRMVVIPKRWYFNDWRAWGGGTSNGAIAFEGFKQAFDFSYEEALRGRPGQVDALVHAELGGRPHLAGAWERMIKYVKQYEDEVWIPVRREIADYCLSMNQEPEEYKPFG